MLIQPLVLCGGSGSRLWPLSREKYPKQLLQLTGADSLFQATLLRLQGLQDLQARQAHPGKPSQPSQPGLETASLAPPLVVCNEEYRFVIAEQLRCIGQRGTLVLEPTGKNTAPALTLGALEAQRNGADPVLLVMPADHVIADTPAFQATVCSALALAQQGAVVTFGITPTGAQTGYGYIQCGAATGQGAARTIQRFVEKPQQAQAERYLQEGNYLWNGGIFMLRASVWLRAMRQCRPDILAACQAAWSAGTSDGEFVRVQADAFAQCPSDSIDYAVMERITQASAGADAAGAPGAMHATQSPPALVLPLTAGWSDVGAWDALWDVLPKDPQGNVTQGDVMLEDSHNTLAFSQGRLVACVGVDGLIVVETPDAVLVAHKDRTQDVKKIVTRLQQTGRSQALNHRKVHRPWGWYDSVDMGARFQVKRIVVTPGASLSLQMHHHRAEHWIVVSGTARVTKGDETLLLSENQSTYIPLGTVHRLENPGRVALEMIEVQSGSYLGEDDIVRFDDVYGRVPA